MRIRLSILLPIRIQILRKAETLERVLKQVNIPYILAVLRIRIRDPGSRIRCLFDPWIQDPV
jgi:hypothetical protein